MVGDIKFHQTWHLQQLPSFYQQFLFIFYSVYKNKPRGVTVKDLLRFIKKNYYLDGDLCPQMITVLGQAIEQGVIEERCDKYHLVGPIASVQDTDPNSPERRTELRNIYGIFNYNSTQRKPRSKASQRGSKNSADIPKIDRATIKSINKRSGSREKCSCVGLALHDKTLADALQSKIPEPKISDNNAVTTSSKFLPNITVLSKIKQYFETTGCQCKSRTSSKTKSKTRSSMSKPSSDTKSSMTMKTASQNSKRSKKSKEVSLQSRDDNSSDEYLSFHSNKSDKQKHSKSNSQNSKSPKLADSSLGISLQATRSKTPTQYTLPLDKKYSNTRSSVSKYSDAHNKSVLSFLPIISTFQHFMGCNECNDVSEKPKVSPSKIKLKPRTVNSGKICGKSCLSNQKQFYKIKKSPKRLSVKFRTMGRDQCNGQFSSLRKKNSKCKACKVRLRQPSTANSSRPYSGNTYTATRTSMRTRSSLRSRCMSALNSLTGSLGRSSISLKPNRPTKTKKKRKSAASSKISVHKKRKLPSRGSSNGESYWGDFGCAY